MKSPILLVHTNISQGKEQKLMLSHTQKIGIYFINDLFPNHPHKILLTMCVSVWALIDQWLWSTHYKKLMFPDTIAVLWKHTTFRSRNVESIIFLLTQVYHMVSTLILNRDPLNTPQGYIRTDWSQVKTTVRQELLLKVQR